MDEINEHYPSSQYECFGRVVSLERAVELVAMAGIVINTLWILYFWVSSPYLHYDGGPVMLCLYILLLVALNKQNPRLFIPFLWINAIGIALHILYCIFVFALLLLHSFWDDYGKQHPGENLGWIKFLLVIHLLLNMSLVALDCWFWQIIHLAYSYMKLQLEREPLIA